MPSPFLSSDDPSLAIMNGHDDDDDDMDRGVEDISAGTATGSASTRHTLGPASHDSIMTDSIHTTPGADETKYSKHKKRYFQGRFPFWERTILYHTNSATSLHYNNNNHTMRIRPGKRQQQQQRQTKNKWVGILLLSVTILMGSNLLYSQYDSTRNWRLLQGKQHLMKRALYILAQRNSNSNTNTNTNANNRDHNILPLRKEQTQNRGPPMERKQDELDDQDPEKEDEDGNEEDGDGDEDEEEGDGDDEEGDGDDKKEESEEDAGETQEEEGRSLLQNLRQKNYQKDNNTAKKNDDITINMDELRQIFSDLNHHVRGNIHGGIRWIQDRLLKELPGQEPNRVLNSVEKSNVVGRDQVREKKRMMKQFKGTQIGFDVQRKNQKPMTWQTEWEKFTTEQRNRGPKVNYVTHSYTYPDVKPTIPENYPPMETMETILARWPQDDIDNPPMPYVERLMHFDYSNTTERQMALTYRDAELPFKVYNVPEVKAATRKWSEEKYLIAGFDRGNVLSSLFSGPHPSGSCQESPDNFFAWFISTNWNLATLGPPPVRNNDWSFAKFTEHAKYADAVSLDFDQPHFYWQSGVPRDERYLPTEDWTFISRDLPSFSSRQSNFFQFNPDEQKGIQCRFGERGVTAATHYDSGRNMIAMVLGAKRYILSPPRECSKLGIVTAKGNPIYRHSLLNFGHVKYLNDTQKQQQEQGGGAGPTPMPERERQWLGKSRHAMTIDTVLKAGEVLYVPSHWFHYITSLQRSAQCNVRSGIDDDGTKNFGGPNDVEECKD